MRCLHCGSYAGSQRDGEMSTAQMLDVADQLADMGLERLTLSGGEPLLRPDWDVIARRLLERGVRLGMISNGFLMHQNLPRFLQLPRFEVVAMSLDGMREAHDAFRRIPGSFDRTVEAFRELRRKGIRTAAITSVSTLNIDQLEQMYRLLSSLSVYAWQLQTLFGGGRMRERPDLQPKPAAMATLARFIAQKRKERRTPMQVFPADCIGYFTDLEEPMRGFRWKGCQAGVQAIGIEANGNVKGCLSLCPELVEDNPFVEGNLQRERLVDIWNKPGAFAYNPSLLAGQGARVLPQVPRTLVECRCGCSAQAHFATGSIYDNPFCLYRIENEPRAARASQP